MTEEEGVRLIGAREGAPLTFADLAAIPVTRLKGVGPRKVTALEHVGVTNVADLLTYYPRRYLDRTHQASIADLKPGEEATIVAKVVRSTSRRTRRGQSMAQVDVTDGSGRMRLTFFNQAWRERQLQEDMVVLVYGRMEHFRGQPQMANPVVDLIGDRTGRIVPVYPQSEKAGVTTWELGNWVAEALRRVGPRGLADPVPPAVLKRWDLIPRQRAIQLVHAPDSLATAELARRRLVFDELLRVQLALVERKRHLELTTRGVAHQIDLEGDSLLKRFWSQLPYALTSAQQRVVAEIAVDLAKPHPMHRLLQGDVGAGKTLVAVCALLVAIEGGWQGALMAPTEVLAEQHHLGIRQMLEGLSVPDTGTLTGDRPLRVELLTHRTTAAERRRLSTALADGQVDLVVGTHALIQDGVAFGRLGLVVIDEQHRFGVEQRAALRDRSEGDTTPDVLVMTATPIPRTAAMTVYGDLDVSTLDELPPGRTPIHTVWVTDETPVWEHVRSQVAAGRQAYVVTPLIEESEKIETASAEETHARLVAPGGELEGLTVGLLHGRLSAAEKYQVMEAFRSGQLDVLVATTVIEVGVDVPNATVMAVLGADRFGIAQLHQLRGRVGRGRHASTCFLVSPGETPQAEARLSALAATTDGFELAEVDLELRGEGTLMGERQTGRNDLKLASLRRDRDWVHRAREAAIDLVENGGLAEWPSLAEEVAFFLGGSDTDYLLKN
ncbi:MAG: ATP-dependent helicase RecG [Acidimicrobiia bacterium]|nr:ATP-dependent helicase RecG [Acidimicrobiia bacterium]